MKKEDLFDILGDINNEYIMEAHMKNKKKNLLPLIRWGAVAACFALLVIGIPMIEQFSPDVDGNKPNADVTPVENPNKVEELQAGKEESLNEQNVSEDIREKVEELKMSDTLGWIVYDNKIYIQDMNVDTLYLESNQDILGLSECLGRASDYLGAYQNNDSCDGDVYLLADNSEIMCIKLDNGGTIWLGLEEANVFKEEEGTIEQNKEVIGQDIPADSKGDYNEDINSDSLTKDTSEFFGGSYTDASGEFVVVLTEDTPQNRAAICKELGRKESNTSFVSGTYTLDYLTELQAKITNAMINGEIPFVVSSGVYEMTNNIIIGVTTNDETELAKVYALDTIGGAIKVEYSSGAGTEELAITE